MMRSVTRCFARGSNLLLALAAALSVLSASAVMAQGWPQRTVKLILPLGPGSGADIGARLIADNVQKRWGQSVIVENRPGGDGITAITAFIGAKDDHTLLLSPSGSFVAHPYMHTKVPYDVGELAPIARISNTIVVVGVPAAMGLSSMDDLVAAVRKAPGKLNWASATGLNEFQFNAFLKELSLDMVRVPYRDAVQAINDLAEGRIQLYTTAYAISRPQVQAGKVKVIALTSSARTDILPGIPTAREAGYPTIEFDGLVGLFGPPSMPAALRARIAADIREALADPEIVKRFTATAQVINPGNPEEFAAAIERQREYAVKAAAVLGLKRAQ